MFGQSKLKQLISDDQNFQHNNRKQRQKKINNIGKRKIKLGKSDILANLKHFAFAYLSLFLRFYLFFLKTKLFKSFWRLLIIVRDKHIFSYQLINNRANCTVMCIKKNKAQCN